VALDLESTFGTLEPFRKRLNLNNIRELNIERQRKKYSPPKS
jgi:hypothetical protein